MDTEMLARLGRIIYGANWQTSLAREANLNPRTIRRYASGELSIPPEICHIYDRLLSNKIIQSRNSINEMARLRLVA